MDAATAELFPDEFEESAVGLIPKEWDMKPLPEAIDINPSRKLAKSETAPYLDMANMPTQGHRPDNWINRPFGSGTKFINGDTLLARITPCLENGKTAFVDFLEDKQVAWGSTEYIILRPKLPLPVEYGYYLARSDELRIFAIQNMTGSSGRQRVPSECFSQYFLAIPSQKIAQVFGDIAKQLMVKISSNSNQSRSLASIRDTLLPKLLSGEIRVKEAEKIVEQAM
jgi:type I restriction enzyme, S subunit